MARKYKIKINGLTYKIKQKKLDKKLEKAIQKAMKKVKGPNTMADRLAEIRQREKSLAERAAAVEEKDQRLDRLIKKLTEIQKERMASMKKG
ncbi:MAG: hypothetical protein HQL54_04150 [Magnetococcales bacterium]|nr:hypothetical protein [Magnetococcales bacterium]